MASPESMPVLEAVAEEMRKLDGTWKQVRYERDGLTAPLDEQGWDISRDTTHGSSARRAHMVDPAGPRRGPRRGRTMVTSRAPPKSSGRKGKPLSTPRSAARARIH